jgi:hypothetical protein
MGPPRGEDAVRGAEVEWRSFTSPIHFLRQEGSQT